MGPIGEEERSKNWSLRNPVTSCFGFLLPLQFPGHLERTPCKVRIKPVKWSSCDIQWWVDKRLSKAADSLAEWKLMSWNCMIHGQSCCLRVSCGVLLLGQFPFRICQYCLFRSEILHVIKSGGRNMQSLWMFCMQASVFNLMQAANSNQLREINRGLTWWGSCR